MDGESIAQNVLARLSPRQAYEWLTRYFQDFVTDVLDNPEVYYQALTHLLPDDRARLDRVLTGEVDLFNPQTDRDCESLGLNASDFGRVAIALLKHYSHVRRGHDLERARAIRVFYQNVGQPYGSVMTTKWRAKP